MKKLFSLIFTLTFVSCQNSHALEVKSRDIKAGQVLNLNQVFKGFGCEGKNISPQISWSNAPKETKSFAFTVYDPDAPTGSGWWHWLVVNIPVNYTKLPNNFGAENKFLLADNITQIRNDFGIYNFGGSCPPKGDKPHRYIFTIYALKTDKLDLKEDATAAFAGFFINQNTIEKASFEAFYSR